MIPHFKRADDLAAVKVMRGSKYVQCDTGNIFISVKADAESGIPVLFIGMPCQVSALKRYLGKDYDNLYLVDIICGGVTSPLLFRAYCRRLSRKIGGKVIGYDFRNKDKHGWSINAKINYEKDGKVRSKYVSGGFEKYILAYFQKSISRESCYRCKFTSIERVGDMTIGDFWGINRWHDELDVSKGISCILINNKKGEKLLAEVDKLIELIPESLEHLMLTNQPLTKPCKRPSYREEVFKEFSADENVEYRAKELGRSHTVVDILTKMFLFVSPSTQRRLQKTFLYRFYKKIVK